MTTHPLSPRTGHVLALVFGGLTLFGFQPVAQAASWKTHGRDVALELGRASSDETVAQAFEIADTVNDAAATAYGTSTAYAVIGKSGPAILSTLKSAGGPVAVGGTMGFGIAGLQDKYLYDDCTTQVACDAAAVSGYVGAAAGTAATVGLGISYGVGAAGLASIGGLIGGGMVVGAVGLIALPAVAAAGIAGGTYVLVDWLSD